MGRGWGGGGGGAELPIYSIVLMCVPNGPLFQRCQVYDWPPFVNKMYMNDPIFLDSYVKGPVFLTSWYMYICFAQRFFEAAFYLGITWTDCDICLTTSKNGYKKSKGSIWIGQHFGWSSIWMGPFFSKARYMNGEATRTRPHAPALPPPPPTRFNSDVSSSVHYLFLFMFVPWEQSGTHTNKSCPG